MQRVVRSGRKSGTCSRWRSAVTSVPRRESNASSEFVKSRRRDRTRDGHVVESQGNPENHFPLSIRAAAYRGKKSNRIIVGVRGVSGGERRGGGANGGRRGYRNGLAFL